MSERWLSILGIGEDGVEGLAPAARALIESAELVVGGARHLALAAPLIRGETLVWASPIHKTVRAITALRGKQVAVLASGDPYMHGIGATLATLVEPNEIFTLPVPSAYSLAAARLGWAMQDVTTHSLCGHDPATLLPHLHPRRRLMVFSADETTPGVVCGLLTKRGFGRSAVHVLEALGGPRERIRTVRADAGPPADVQPLNMLAIQLEAAPGAAVIPLARGLPDAMFEHDGQMTKAEIRAVTLAALAPGVGETLWDIGCGSGSIAIEWLLCHPANRAIGIEPVPERAARAARNALALGVPRLEIVPREAPAALSGLPVPDKVFIGGGARDPGVVEACCAALPPGGRMVINAVTIETEALLYTLHARRGGTLIRLSVDRLDTVGTLHGFRKSMTITQWAAVKP